MRRAFTLIELLVTITIIAVLIGLLLPALSHARATARNDKCLAQLRDLSVAVAAYQADHRMAYPSGLAAMGYGEESGIAGAEEPAGGLVCPANPAGEPYAFMALSSGNGAIVDTLREWIVASDAFTFRHGLRRGERPDQDPNSMQWLRTWRNKGFLSGGAGRRYGPTSICGDPFKM